jgi:hypothetical protein
MVTKRYSRPDNVFASPGVQEMVVKCDVVPTMRPPHTDHFPIATILSLPQGRTDSTPRYNFREVDWDEFRKNLKSKLADLPVPGPLQTQDQLTQVAGALMAKMGESIEECVKRSKPRPHSKRWWNSDLKERRRALNQLRVDSYRYRASTDHPSHSELRAASNKYGEAIVTAKRQHWAAYLEDMNANNIWTANKYLKEPAGDSSNPRIPTLKTKNGNDEEVQTSDNSEKANIFAKTFFPPLPPDSSVPNNFEYPEPLPPRQNNSKANRRSDTQASPI